MSTNVPTAVSDGCLDSWLLAYTRPRQEAVALLNLERQGFQAYLPLFRTIRRGVEAPVFEPMFPRYVFLRRRSAGQSLGVVRSTRGVVSLVRFGVEFGRLPDDAIRGIREIERLRREASREELCGVRAGQKVVVCSGPLKGLDAIVHSVSSKRVVVLLELLGRHSRVALGHEQLAAA